MIKKIFLIGVIIVITLPCFAQNIKGIITNAKQHPLKGIKVWRKNTTESVKTDKMGVFMFTDLTQTDTLIISVSKKEEAAIPVQDLKEIVIKLEKKITLFMTGSMNINESIRKYFV